MGTKTERITVDLDRFPDLVVIYLGMRVHTLRGLGTLIAFGRQIAQSIEVRPEGLLLHENLTYSLLPPHLGMRQYWRDLDSLEAWTRQQPHQGWWKSFLADPAGTGFWHETYFGSHPAARTSAACPNGVHGWGPGVLAGWAWLSGPGPDSFSRSGWFSMTFRSFTGVCRRYRVWSFV